MNIPPRWPGARLLRRGWNALLRLRSGLRLVAESVSPEIPNDLFLAHLSIYSFFSRFTAGQRVLDLGCGTGYGCHHLVEQGAGSVLGVDLDPASIRYARRKYSSPRLTFRVEDAQRVPPDLGPFDVVVSSNALEHLPRPERALDAATRSLADGGRLLAAVPPIVDDATLRENQRNRFHRSNLFLWQWHDLLTDRFQEVLCFRQQTTGPRHPDFSDPFPTTLTLGDFAFVETPLDELRRSPSLGVVLSCVGGSSAR